MLFPYAFFFICPCYTQGVVPDAPCSILLKLWATSYYSKRNFPDLASYFSEQQQKISPSSQFLCRISIRVMKCHDLDFGTCADQLQEKLKILEQSSFSGTNICPGNGIIWHFSTSDPTSTPFQSWCWHSQQWKLGENCWFEFQVTSCL